VGKSPFYNLSVEVEMMIALDVNRPDPENREFEHSDPIGWTVAHRGEILCALYTVVLGNPRRIGKRDGGSRDALQRVA
jgi:hypothetical protein